MRKIVLALLIALAPGLAFAANLQTVTLNAGVPNSGTGTVSTLDAILGSGPKTLTDLATAIAATNTTLNAPMQNSGGSVTANAGTNLNTSLLSTSALQSTINTSIGTSNTALAAIQTSAATIATNSGLQIPAGTNAIGYLTGQYPGGAVPITSSTTGTTTAITA